MKPSLSHALIALAAVSTAASTSASSLQFVQNKPAEYDFVDIANLPPQFGQAEFAFELWIKPDRQYPVGPVWRASYDQLKNWSDADPQPYSGDGWWLAGNWLLDGHTRPEGFGPGNSREGTFSLQFYGGGRLRFMFADTKLDMPKGMVHAVQAWPANTTPSLLDDKWHHVVAVRRWREPSGATLELWIDGRRIAATDIPRRTDMRRFWDKLSHPNDPVELGGWSLGAEVMTAWNHTFTQYEDYKGLVAGMRFWNRAPRLKEIEGWAKAAPLHSKSGLLADFPLGEGKGDILRDRINPRYTLKLHRPSPTSWNPESGPQEK